MQLSSNCLFHFTKSFKNIKTILEQEAFIPSYCKEKNWLSNSENIYVPQVSFCDIPLSNTSKIESYGDYALGLSMSWGEKNKLNPVSYLNNNSVVFERFTTLSKTPDSYGDLAKRKKMLLNMSGIVPARSMEDYFAKIPTDVLEIIKNSITNFQQYTKEYSGTLDRSGKKPKLNYKFYDEKEWRFTPPPSHQFLDFFNQSLWETEGKEIFKQKPHFKNLPNSWLRFDKNDIEYIILKNSNDIDELIKYFTKNKSANKDLLLTKVLDFEKLKRDI